MQSKTAKYIALVAVAVVAAMAIYFGVRHTDSQKQPNSNTQRSAPQKVVINEAARTLLYLPLYHAVQKGYFKDAGLDVEIVTGGTATASFAAMLSGEADFSQADPMYVPIAREKGERSRSCLKWLAVSQSGR